MPTSSSNASSSSMDLPICRRWNPFISGRPKAVLDSDLQTELSAHSLYAEAATHCHSVKDYVTRDLFEQLMHDEEEHIDFLETQIELVARIGHELYAQRHIGELGED